MAGKFLSLNGCVFRCRGVTYGTFPPRPRDGQLFPETSVIRSDFKAMAALGINTVRTYLLPPPDMIEVAGEAGLRLLSGLNHHDWRDEPTPGRAARRRVVDSGRRAADEALERCAGRQEILAIVVGNEIPADVVRLHGTGSVEDALAVMVEQIHEGDPGMLTTYCNYPTTEYLEVAGQDFASFNVFLESQNRLQAYLHHLHVVAGAVPLVITELGLASALHGDETQARSLAWQLRAVDECGCAGAMVFSWTDEWAVAGQPVTGWGFGLHDAARRPRPAAAVVSRWARRGVRDLRGSWPGLSVVVCAYNAERTLGQCLESLLCCRYPGLEIIVCDDGSADGTREVARRFPVRLLELPHVGLSSARNAGIAEASSEIVAFLDADAACHPEWPFHLWLALEDDKVTSAGGPNLPMPGAGFVERAVARCPGNPVEVLRSDDRADHVPGCNVAFKKEALVTVGGFDPVYTTAGDDVDISWKLLDRGHEISFAPAAQVWHHRRSSVRAFLSQQVGYGRAEHMVYRRHRHRFNRVGQARWVGFIYAYQPLLPRLLRPVVYHGALGLAPFQPVIRRPSVQVAGYASAYLPLAVPLAAAGAVLAAFHTWWLALSALACLFVVMYATAIAAGAPLSRSEPNPLAFRLLVAFLHVAQPLARTWGRIRGGPDDPLPARSVPAWTGDRFAWLMDLERELMARRCSVRASDSDAEWDLTVWVGPMIRCNVTTAVVWHWLPRCRLRFRPRAVGVLAVLATTALTLSGVGPGKLLLLMMLALPGVEAIVLSRIVRGALRCTTQGTAE